MEALVGEPLSHQDVDLFARLEDRERILAAVGERMIVETSNLLFCNFDFVEVDASSLSAADVARIVGFMSMSACSGFSPI